MPEIIRIPTAPVVRTPGFASQSAGSMQTAVQLTFAFEIASMQLTPTFKMGAVQLRPSSRIVTMRLASAQHPRPAMNLQVNFEISKIQPSGGTLGNIRLTPSQQQRPTPSGSPSFTVAGLQLVSDFAAAPLQLTPSQQGQTSVHVTAPFQIATVEFSRAFEIASIVLNSNSKRVSVQLPGAGRAEGAPIFEIANLQLTGTGDIGMMKLHLLGDGPRRPDEPSSKANGLGEEIELNRLKDALSSVLRPGTVDRWLETPNEEFDGLTPAELIDRGESDRLWWMIEKLELGEPLD